MRKTPAPATKSRMSIRHKFDKDDVRPILGDLVRAKRNGVPARVVGVEAGVKGYVVRDVESYYSAKRDELLKLCAWVGKLPEQVQMPPPLLYRYFGGPKRDGSSDKPILDDILKWLASGKPLSKYESKRFQVHSRRAESMVRKYLLESEEFSKAYARAREIGSHFLVDQTIDIADDPEINPSSASNMIRARQWIAARHNATVYGNNSKTDFNVNVGLGEAMEQLEKRRQRNASLPAPDVIDVEVIPLVSLDERPKDGEAVD